MAGKRRETREQCRARMAGNGTRGRTGRIAGKRARRLTDADVDRLLAVRPTKAGMQALAEALRSERRRVEWWKRDHRSVSETMDGACDDWQVEHALRLQMERELEAHKAWLKRSGERVAAMESLLGRAQAVQAENERLQQQLDEAVRQLRALRGESVDANEAPDGR